MKMGKALWANFPFLIANSYRPVCVAGGQAGQSRIDIQQFYTIITCPAVTIIDYGNCCLKASIA